MKKLFVYQVGSWECSDTEAFGTAWKQAVAKAREAHTGVYRLVIRGEEVRQEALLTGWVFLPVTPANAADVVIF